MIAKILPTPTFAKATRYVLDRDPDLHHAGARELDRNMVGRDAEELAHEFALVADGNPRVRHVVAHIAVRLSPEDRRLSDREWREVVRAYMDQLGYHDTPYLLVQHPEPDQHVHIVASRVRFDGSRVNDHRERSHSRQIVRALEREHDLVHTQERLHEWDRARERDRGYEREHERDGR